MIAKNYIFGRKYGVTFLTDLVGYYPLNSDVNDYSGNSHNGTAYNSPTFVAGKVSNAINFGNDNSVRFIDIADNDDFSFTNGTTDVPFTISMWVNFSAFNTGNWFISKRSALNDLKNEYQFSYYENRLNFYKFQFNNNSIYQQIATSTSPFSLNTWYHICYTDNGSGSVGSGKIYINGVLNVAINQNVGGTYTRMNNNTQLTRIGTISWGASSTFKHRGLIDELAIWKNRELTATEVLELYNKGNAGTPII